MAWTDESKEGDKGMGWNSPKTDWTADDRLNFEDYNRIKNNLAYVWEKVCEIWGSFPIEDMGEDIASEAASWQSKYFNAIESNVDTINRNTFTKDYGIRQTFYDNGPFIRWAELNRLEGATLQMKQIADGTLAGRVRLSFRLGGQKGLKV